MKGNARDLITHSAAVLASAADAATDDSHSKSSRSFAHDCEILCSPCVTVPRVSATHRTHARNEEGVDGIRGMRG